MIRLAVTCFIVALVAGLFGLTGVHGAALFAAKVLFTLFTAGTLLFGVIGLTAGKAMSSN